MRALQELHGPPSLPLSGSTAFPPVVWGSSRGTASCSHVRLTADALQHTLRSSSAGCRHYALNSATMRPPGVLAALLAALGRRRHHMGRPSRLPDGRSAAELE